MKTTKYIVTFQLEVEGDETEGAIEEAITTVVDEELVRCAAGGTRCGIKFVDAVMFSVEKREL